MSTFRISLLTSVVLVIVLLHIARMEVAANQCNNNFDCRRLHGSTLKYCCRAKQTYFGSRICGANCVGNSCKSSTDCAPGECCLNGKCRNNCITGSLAGGTIAGIIIGVIILIAIPISIIACCCCCCGAAAASASRPPVNRGVILAQPGGVQYVTSQNVQSQASLGYPVASHPGAPVYPAPLQNLPPYNPYPLKPGQDQPPQQAQGPPPTYSAP